MPTRHHRTPRAQRALPPRQPHYWQVRSPRPRPAVVARASRPAWERSAARAMASVARAGAILRRQLPDTSTRGAWRDRGDNTNAARAGRGRSAGPDSHRLGHRPGRPSNPLQGQLRGAPAASALFVSTFLLTTPGNHLLVSVALDFGPNGPSMRPSGGRVATQLPSGSSAAPTRR